jgi:hypothetical protein
MPPIRRVHPFKVVCHGQQITEVAVRKQLFREWCGRSTECEKQRRYWPTNSTGCNLRLSA